jgi:hypothetical protein
MPGHGANLMRLHQRYCAIVEEFGDVPELQRELARAKQQLTLAFETFNEWRQWRKGLCATRDDRDQLC